MIPFNEFKSTAFFFFAPCLAPHSFMRFLNKFFHFYDFFNTKSVALSIINTTNIFFLQSYIMGVVAFFLRCAFDPIVPYNLNTMISIILINMTQYNIMFT